MAREGKPLAPKKRLGSKPKLDERARMLLAADVEERPFVTLSERRDYLKVVAGVSVSNSTVRRELGRMEYTLKRGHERG
jgi:transposase